ncbi:MAG: hypothetical protein AAGH71_08235, partial [Planctomycetota bacterium]
MLYGTKAVLLAASIGVIGVGQARAQVFEWNNVLGGNWTDGGNWDQAVSPTLPTHTASIALMGTYTINYTGTGSSIGSLQQTNPDATLTIQPFATLGLNGNSLNNGLIQLNPAASSANAVLSILADTTMSGSGEIWMRTSIDNSQIAGTGVFTNSAGHTVRGVGQIFAPLNNAGRVAADVAVSVSGNDLEMRSATTNSGRLAAASNSILEVIGGTVITQPSGEIVAENGGVVSLL